MTILHILKEADSRDALSFIRGKDSSSPGETGIVLIQGARGLSPQSDASHPTAKVFVLEDLQASGKPEGPGPSRIDYGELVDLIFEWDKVAVW